MAFGTMDLGTCLFGFRVQDNSKPVVAQQVTGTFDAFDNDLRRCRNGLPCAGGVVRQRSDLEHLEPGPSGSILERFGSEKTSVGTGKDVVYCRGTAQAVEPGSNRDNHRAVVRGVEDQFPSGLKASPEGLQDRDWIDQVFDDVHHGDGIEHQIGLHIGNVTVAHVEALFAGPVGQGFAKLDAGRMEPHRFCGLKHHSEPRANVEQFGWLRMVLDTLKTGLEDIRIQRAVSGTRVIGVVDEAFGILFVVHFRGSPLERFEDEVASVASSDVTVKSICMGFRSSNIVQQTARCGFADWAVFVGKCHLDRILSVN